MKKSRLLAALTILLLPTIGLFAQVPASFRYQAILRDNTDNAITDASVVVKFRLISTSPDGTILWEEEHSATTSSIGLINLNIGEGRKSGGTLENFNDIAWASDTNDIVGLQNSQVGP